MTRRPWILRPPVEPPAALAAAVGGHPLVAQLLAQRGITSVEAARAFLDPAHYTPAPPSALVGLERAAELLCRAVKKKQGILVWGDFDVDGQTSTALLVTALRRLLGEERVHFHVPSRFREGHGIRPAAMSETLAALRGKVQVVLTCDTGIADGPGVAVAKEAGLTVIVTDHHDLPAEFQPLDLARDPLWGIDAAVAGNESVRRADAVVNPKFSPPGDPLRTLPGVGVAYKLVQQLYALCGAAGEETSLLDLVALGIVADVAEQVHDARYLLQLGLDQLRGTKRIGLLALLEVARIKPENISADSIGFQIGPRMNAVGRLDDATVSVELLTTTDPLRARQLAGTMERLNQERRVLTSQTATTALEMVERNPALLDYSALVLDHPAWHAGIVGIVASRLVEEFHKPAILLLTPPGEAARGSARSIPGVNIYAAISACSHLLKTHGGHAGAAGLSLLPENIERFRRQLDFEVEQIRDPSAADGLLVDAELPLAAVSLELADEIHRLAPFGAGNPTPVFLFSGLTIGDDRRIGREGTHRKLLLRDGTGAERSLLWFGGADAEAPIGAVDVCATLNRETYQGERSVSLLHVGLRATQAEAVAAAPLTVVDQRGMELAALDLPAPDVAAWYAEGTALETNGESTPYSARWALPGNTKETLVLWSIPPSGELLEWLAATARARTIIVCGRNTGDDRAQSVLRAVAEMCKFAINRGTPADINRMAARIGSTEAVVRQSLLWLERRGEIRVEGWQRADGVRLARGSGMASDDEAREVELRLHELLAEVRAYRRFFQRARVDELGLEPPRTP